MAVRTNRYLRLAGHRLGVRALREGGRRKLLCFPYAGGQSLGFRRLAEMLGADWTVWGIDPPGHGWTVGPALRSVPEMVDLYLREIPEDVVSGAMFLGHSLGGLVAWAAANELSRRGSPPPGIVLSAARPPHCKGYIPFTSLDDQRLLTTMIDLGGIPAEWASEPDTFDLFKDALRADFLAFESFEPDGPSNVPATVVGAYQDVVCRPEHVFEWSRYCPGCEIDFVPGGHLFIQSPPDRFVQMIRQFAQRLVE